MISTLSLYCLFHLLGLSCASLRCGQETVKQSNRFFFAAACVRSKMTVIGATYSSTLKQCSQYAMRRRGLAINFLNRHLLHESVKNFSGETCLVFDCPEFDVQLSLEIDSLYDYYTLYARPMPSSNVTCIPRLGVFQVHHERLNFTDAEDMCNMEDGDLADASDEQRSVYIADILSKEGVKQAYIDMAQEEGRFVTQSGMPLECIEYRAWAPGEPKHGRKCVSLSEKGFWTSHKCEQRLPFVCQLRPSGPLRPCVNLPQGWKERCKETYIRSFPTSTRWPKCGDPLIDENTFRLPILQTQNFTTEESENKKQAIEDRRNALKSKKRRIPS